MDGMELSTTGTDAWLEALRARMLEVALRRVDADDAEDVVQSALRVVAERGLSAESSRVDGLPPLAWCFQVLRNTIGNHYKRQRIKRRHIEENVDLARVSKATGSNERLLALQRALDELESEDRQCGALLRSSIDGLSAREIADERGLDVSALYQRLYRCRRRLREMLRERGVLG